MLLTTLDGTDPCTRPFSLTPHPSPLTSPSAPGSAPRLPREPVIVPGLLLPHSLYLLCPLPGHPFSGLSRCFLHFLQVSAQTPPFQRGKAFFNPFHSLHLILPGLSVHSACLVHKWHTRLLTVRAPLTAGETPGGGECIYPFTAVSPAPRPAPKAIQTLKSTSRQLQHRH